MTRTREIRGSSLEANNHARLLSAADAKVKYNISKKRISKKRISKEKSILDDDDFIYLFSYGKFSFNFETKKIEYDQEHIENVIKKRADSDVEKYKLLKEKALRLVHYMNYFIKDAVKFDEVSNPKIFKASTEEKCFIPKPVKGYYTHSLYRYQHEVFQDMLQDFSSSLVVSSYIARLVDTLNEKKSAADPDFFFRELSPKLSQIAPNETANLYLRDSSIVVGQKLYFPLREGGPKVIKVEGSEDNDEINLQDFSSEIKDAKTMPFRIQGGSVVVDEAKKIIFLQDMFQMDDSDEFIKTVKEPTIKKMNDWALSLGYKPIIVETTPEKAGLTHDDVYHLDLFMNVIGPYIIVPDEEIISKDLRRSLIETYGAKNIIRLTKEERENLCTNFITFGNTVLMTSSKTPQTFVDKLTSRGFDVVVPPMMLQRGDNSGVRCFTQISPASLEELRLESMQVRHYEKSSDDESLRYTSARTPNAQRLSKEEDRNQSL